MYKESKTFNVKGYKLEVENYQFCIVTENRHQHINREVNTKVNEYRRKLKSKCQFLSQLSHARH